MGAIASPESDMQRVGDEAVIGEAALPRKQARVLDALHARAHVSRAQASLERVVRGRRAVNHKRWLPS